MQRLPNYLTFMRILVIPGVVASFSFPGTAAAWIGCGLFIAASVTDYFDGYLARKFKSTSSLGRIFDPIADKLLVAATLLMMAAYDRLGYTGLWCWFPDCASFWPKSGSVCRSRGWRNGKPVFR